uniref:ELMO domain containing 2 n=2 Tax=Equus TaxID=9789 RepID=A0A9L0SPV5_HORSE
MFLETMEKTTPGGSGVAGKLCADWTLEPLEGKEPADAWEDQERPQADPLARAPAEVTATPVDQGHPLQLNRWRDKGVAGYICKAPKTRPGDSSQVPTSPPFPSSRPSIPKPRSQGGGKGGERSHPRLTGLSHPRDAEAGEAEEHDRCERDQEVHLLGPHGAGWERSRKSTFAKEKSYTHDEQQPKGDLLSFAKFKEKMFVSLWEFFYGHFFRFWMKWLLRQMTGKCELQRIFDTYVGAQRTHRIENSLTYSKNKVLQKATLVVQSEVDKCVEDIMKEKNINPEKDASFKICMKACLLQISGYKQLYLDVESVRKKPYDSDNMQHEKLLLKLWNLLMPTKTLKARISKQWADIGFQGDDPKTDFRGMGILGLINLVYFSENYTSEAHQILSRSNHPKLGYSYAIVGINLTEMAYSLLKSEALKFHLYNFVPGVPTMEHFHQFYCYLVYEFDKFWFEEKPESIMYFNIYREKFHEKIKGLLLDCNVSLTLKI